MADDIQAKAVVNADTSQAKNEVGGLRGIFGSFFEGLREGAASVDKSAGAAGGSMDGLVGSVTKGVFSGNLLTKAFDTVVGVFSKVGSSIGSFIGDSIKMNSSLEKSTLQFATLMGNSDQAAEHVKFLFEFAKKTPFETGPIIEASRVLQTFGGTALNSQKNLTLFGDAAAATSAPIQDVSMWSGRLYAALQAGKPFGEAAQRLGELAIMTPKTRMELEAMQKSGANGEAIWTKYQESLGKFTGAMEKQSHTWEGLTSSISDSINILGGRVFEPFFELAKGGLERTLDLLSDKGVEGAVTRFGDASGVAFDIAKEALTPLVDALFGSTKAWAAAADSASFNEKVVRGVVSVLAGLVDAFAWLVRAIATGVQAYYEFRIAGNLLLIGFAKVVEGILQGAIAISTAMSKITFGETRKEWEASTARMSENLGKVQTDIAGLKEDTEGFRKKSEETGASMRGFADKLNVASGEMREHAKSYTYVPPEQKKVVDSTRTLTGGFDEAGAAAGKASKKISDFVSTSSFDIAKLKTEWDKQPASIRANEESIRVLLDKYEKLRKDAIGPLPADLERLRAEHQKALPTQEKYAANLLTIGHNVGLIGQPLNLAARETIGLTESWTLASRSIETNVGLMPNMVSGLMKQKTASAESAAQTERLWGQLDGLAKSFAQLGQITGGTTGVVGTIGSMVGAMSLGKQATEGWKGNLDLLQGDSKTGLKGVAQGAMGLAGNLVGMYGAMQEATNKGTATANMIGGMTTGMTMGGQVAGPWGAAVGAAVGAIWGAFKGKPDWAKIQTDIQRDFGVAVSETLAKEIEKTSKEVGDRSTAIMLHLGDVVKDMGGVTAANVGDVTAKVRDLFSFVERGAITTQQAAEQLNAVFPQLAKTITDGNKLAGDSFLELIRLDAQFGTKSAEIANFVRSQISSVIIPGLQAWQNEFTSAADVMTAKNAERSKLEDELSRARTEKERAEIRTRLAVLDQSQTEARGIIAATAIKTQEQASGVTEAIAVTFNKLRSEGMSTSEALRLMGPSIRTVQTQLEEAGLTGSDAFNSITEMANLASDKVAGPTLNAVQGLDQMMRGLHNSGLMNDTMFRGLSSQVTQAFTELKAQGHDGDTVLRSMQPTLQMLWEEQQKFGRTVDATTQDMLDQAVASGVVGGQYMSAQDRMAASTKHLDDVLTAMARKMGIDVPAAADNMAARGVDAANRVGGALGGVTAPNVDNVSNKLNATQWEQYQMRAQIAAQNAGGALISNLGGAIGTVGGKLNENIGAWDRWENEARGAAGAVRREVDGISFGASPGGIKEWVPMLRNAGRQFLDFGSSAAQGIRRVRSEVDALGLDSMPSIDVNGRATSPVGLGMGGGGTIQNIHVDARGSIYEEQQTIKRFANRFGDAIADQHFAGNKVSATEGSL